MHESHEPIKEEAIAEAKENLEQERVEEQTAFSVCQKELEQYKNLYFHVTADFQNYKRRIEKGQASLKRLFQQGLLLDVLAILDDVERALESDVQSDVAWRAGLELIAKNIYKILAKYNV